ncbi:unnamed protein product [Owenia fusiformis]|uniref:Uncharacterized protein n=1 Tax=Owenia fusiformis TaxID=6347 RepID=A0A8S4N1K2_OWEFU|nr:unnamed protein product [Owenia fusiformis]
MATSLSEEVKQDLIECKICLEVMKTPKVLNCLHTFCEGCIEDLGRKMDQKDDISCPVCRNVTTLPPGGVKALRANFLINTLQDALGKSTQLVKCEFCDDTCSFMCLDCNDKMCSSHGSSHCSTKFTRGHKVVPMDDVNAGKYAKEILASQFIECNTHQGKCVEFYCTQCEMMLCVSCKILNHEGHKCTSLEEAGKSEMATIEETLSEMADMNKVLKQFKSELEKAQTNLIQDRASIVTTIDKIADKMYNEIRRQQAELKFELNSIFNSQTKSYELEKEEIEMNIASVNSGIEFEETLLKHGRPVDVLSFAEHVKDNVKGIMSSFNDKCQQLTKLEEKQNHNKWDVLECEQVGIPQQYWQQKQQQCRRRHRTAHTILKRTQTEMDPQQPNQQSQRGKWSRSMKTGITLSFQENIQMTNPILGNTQLVQQVRGMQRPNMRQNMQPNLQNFGNICSQNITVQINGC